MAEAFGLSLRFWASIIVVEGNGVPAAILFARKGDVANGLPGQINSRSRGRGLKWEFRGARPWLSSGSTAAYPGFHPGPVLTKCIEVGPADRLPYAKLDYQAVRKAG